MTGPDDGLGKPDANSARLVDLLGQAIGLNDACMRICQPDYSAPCPGALFALQELIDLKLSDARSLAADRDEEVLL